jgi:predicted  nucleic acid-binding Zn-ribbon protein
MTRESVSFRITRNTEDLAQTIHALSQRLVTLEQRLAALELVLERRSDADPSEVASLDNVERLLEDCRQLLDLDGASEVTDPPASAEDESWLEAA